MDGAWWGRCVLGEGQTAYWRVGPLDLWLTARGSDWHLASRCGDAGAAPHHALPADRAPPEHPQREAVFRFGTRPEAVDLVPALPDRPVVSRPSTALFVPAGETALLYLSTPLWLVLRAAGAAALLIELPVQVLSDTWFGASTRSGELCYASRIEARAAPAEHTAAHAALTPVTIRNHTAVVQPLERISLPAPLLGLYEGADGRFWTEPVTVEHYGPEELARVTLGPGAPPQAGAARRIAAPRRRGTRSLALRTVSALLGGNAA